jgi:hypothetical protein
MVCYRFACYRSLVQRNKKIMPYRPGYLYGIEVQQSSYHWYVDCNKAVACSFFSFFSCLPRLKMSSFCSRYSTTTTLKYKVLSPYPCSDRLATHHRSSQCDFPDTTTKNITAQCRALYRLSLRSDLSTSKAELTIPLDPSSSILQMNPT